MASTARNYDFCSFSLSASSMKELAAMSPDLEFEPIIGVVIARTRQNFVNQLKDPNGTTIVTEEVSCPDQLHYFQVPPEVVPVPVDLKLFVLDVLSRMNLVDGHDLGSEMESCIVQAADIYGVEDFVVCCDVEIKRTLVLDNPEYFELTSMAVEVVNLVSRGR